MIIRPPSLRDRMLLPEEPFLSRRRRAPGRRPLEFLLNPYRFGATVLSNAPWFEIATWTGDGVGNHTHTGLDLSNGGLVWVTARNAGVDNTLYFKASSGATVYSFSTCNVSAAVSGGGGATLDSTGFTVPLNVNARTYVAWVFKKTAGEVDIVTWTGNGTTGRTVAHSLGVTPKMLFTTALTGTKINYMQHQSLSATKYMRMDTTAQPVTDNGIWNDVAATSSVFTLGSSTLVNANTVPFAAFLFAGQYFEAGAFTGTGASLNVSGIGFTPQFIVMGKPSNNWGEFDITRTPAYTGNDAVLLGNIAATESTSTDTLASIAGGVSVAAGNFNSNGVITHYWCVK